MSGRTADVPVAGSREGLGRRVDVSSWPVKSREMAGDSPGIWLEAPDVVAWLFKPVVVKSGHRQGEDWSEFLAWRVADALDVPAAEVAMASRVGEDGSISRNVRPPDWSDQPGSVLLSALVPNFDKRARDRAGHSLANIETVLRGFLPPNGCAVAEAQTAFDVFVGYLVLDAVIANRDRHSDNWSVVASPNGGDRRLMASYDHASCLGWSLRDPDRILAAPAGVESWVHRGTAVKFEGGRRVTLVALAAQALGAAAAPVRDAWLGRVEALNRATLERIVEQPQGMSDPARTFAVRVMDLNRRRLLDDFRRC